MDSISMRLYFSQQYLASEYQFDTTRKAGWIAESLSSQLIPGVELVEPVPLTVEEIAKISTNAYIKTFQNGEPTYFSHKRGFDWAKGSIFQLLIATGDGRGELILGEHLREERGIRYLKDSSVLVIKSTISTNWLIGAKTKGSPT